MKDQANAKKVLPLANSHRLLSPRLVYLISTLNEDGTPNVAPFSYVCPVSVEPPRLVVSINHEAETLKNIKSRREFVVNVPSIDDLQAVWICGNKSSQVQIPRGCSKLIAAAITANQSIEVQPPSIAECYAHLECLTHSIQDVGDHTMVIADVLSTSCNLNVLAENEILALNTVKPLMHIAQDMFSFPSTVITVNTSQIQEVVDDRVTSCTQQQPDVSEP